MNEEGLFVGQLVQVRSADEILSMVDDNGTLDGLPFMPEMLNWCGKLFRVQRRVDKTCVDVVVRYTDGFLQMTWWSWTARAAMAAVTTDASTGAEFTGSKRGYALSTRTMLELSLSTPSSTNCEFILR